MSARYATKFKVFFIALSIALAPVAQAKILIRPNGVASTQGVETNRLIRLDVHDAGGPVAQCTGGGFEVH